MVCDDVWKLADEIGEQENAWKRANYEWARGSESKIVHMLQLALGINFQHASIAWIKSRIWATSQFDTSRTYEVQPFLLFYWNIFFDIFRKY